MKKPFLISDLGISIDLKNDTTLIIGGVHFRIEGEIKFMEKVVHLQENGSSINILIDNNDISKQNYYTSIKKQDIRSVWYKGKNIWETWRLEKILQID